MGEEKKTEEAKPNEVSKKATPAQQIQVAEEFVADLTKSSKDVTFPNAGCRFRWRFLKAQRRADDVKERYEAWKDRQMGRKSVQRKVNQVKKLRERLAALEGELKGLMPEEQGATSEAPVEAEAKPEAAVAAPEAPPVVVVE